MGCSKINWWKGKVDESNTRVKFILSELNGALGTEMEMTDGVIGKYSELKTSIDDLILKKKAMIVLEAGEEAYRDAIKNKVQAEKRS